VPNNNKKKFRKPQRGNGPVFQDPSDGAPMEVYKIPMAARPKMHYGQDYLPGTGYVKIPDIEHADPYRGGIFGQPPAPAGRMGIFKSYWSLPPSMMYNDTGVFTPFTQRRIPGTCMDCGPELGAALGQTDEIITDATAVVDTAVGEGQSFLKKLGNWMFGPLPINDPRTPKQIARDNEKKAWIRTGLVVAALWYVTRPKKTE
jgi:hypothetical protein